MDDSSDLIFFIGAGASAPFGIPTMKRLVELFEKELEEKRTEDEIWLFSDIKKTLEKELKRQVDLEDVFTVINGIINFDLDRFGLVAAYMTLKEFSKLPKIEDNVKIYSALYNKFEESLRKYILIFEDEYSHISSVYSDFFNTCYDTSTFSGGNHQSKGNYKYCPPWRLFTTNYDTCLEYYWREIVRIRLNTGFEYDPTRHIHRLSPKLLSIDPNRPMGYMLHLFKLHGSINWLKEPDGTVTEQNAIQLRSFMGRRYLGPMMIYPIQQKELYVEPFISMFVQLNIALRDKKNWIIIGYSFNDPIIREIFLRNSDESKHIVFLHPHGNEITRKHLSDLKYNHYEVLQDKFGMHDNYQEINKLIAASLH